MKFILFLLLTFFTSTLFAQEPTLRATPYKYVEDSIGKGKPHFVEFGSDSCYSCQVMGKELYKQKQKSPSFNIEFVDVKHERKAAYKFEIRMIPTQVIFDSKGKEVYRHIGLLQKEELNALFTKYNF